MKKVLISLLVGVSLFGFVGCSKEEVKNVNIDEYINSTIQENENMCTLYHCGNIEKEEFVNYYQDQIDTIDCVLKKVDGLDQETIEFANEYKGLCEDMLSSGISKYNEIYESMEDEYNEYVKETNEFEKIVLENREKDIQTIADYYSESINTHEVVEEINSHVEELKGYDNLTENQTNFIIAYSNYADNTICGSNVINDPKNTFDGLMDIYDNYGYNPRHPQY